MGKPSVYEVADKAGVSIATVSRALNQPHRVSNETRERVLAAVKELNYSPDTEAAARARSVTHRIGVVAPLSTYPGFSSRLRGISLGLEDPNSELIIIHVDAEKLKSGTHPKFIEAIAASGRYDGLIIMSLPLEGQNLDRLAQTKFPMVLVETDDPRFPSIQVDHEYGARLATQYLINQGYKKLGYIGFKKIAHYSIDSSKLRERGFLETLRSNGMSTKDQFVNNNCEYGIDGAYEATRAMIARKDRPDAIFCASDLNALGAMKAISEAGLSVPGDIAVIGFDDIDIANYLGLTTIRQPLDNSGRAAVNLVNQLIKHHPIATRKVLLNLELIERETA
jgi:LacI family transcriptional regulator